MGFVRLCILLTIALVACAPAPETDVRMVDAEGGTVEVDGVRLTVPVGGLAQPVALTITDTGQQPPGHTLATHVFSFEPHGTQFLVPVEVAFFLPDDTELPTVYWSGSGGSFEPLATARSGEWLVAEVEHFSEGYGADAGGCPGDADSDGDGVCDADDGCPAVADPDQADGDGDGVGDACDACTGDDASGDPDADGICSDVDTCPAVADPDQADADGDTHGDACDLCPAIYDAAQRDGDGDGIGDACDLCIGEDVFLDPDDDGWCSDIDNCPAVPNPAQADADVDATGDACDQCRGHDATLDLDGDGLCGDVEVAYGSDPLDADTDDDGLSDLEENADADADVDPGETSAVDPDTDDDHLCDGPRADNDGDGLQPADPCYSAWFVDAAATAPGDGRSWATALTTLDEGVAAASAGHEVWATAGTYGPVTLPAGVALRGGFSGIETFPDARMEPLVVSVIDGDLDGSGTFTAGDAGPLVTAGPDTLLDGFELRHGFDPTGTGGAGLRVDGAGIVALDRVVVADNRVEGQSAFGGGVLVPAGATLYVTQSEIRSNAAVSLSTTSTGEAGGGGISATDATVALTDSIVDDNTVIGAREGAHGGGIGSTGGTLAVEGGSVSGNALETPGSAWGGGIAAFGAGVVLDGTTVAGNDGSDTFSCEGGGVYVRDGSLDCLGCVIEDNDGTRGGGVNVDATEGVVRIEDAILRDNRAEEGGGAYLGADDIAILRTTFTGNTALVDSPGWKGNGGGASVFSWDALLEEVTFQDNQATSRAGALYLGAVFATVTDSELRGNRASSAGALYAKRTGGFGSELRLIDVGVTGNVAGHAGAALFAEYEDIELRRVSIVGNLLEGSNHHFFQGGATVFEGGPVRIIDSTIADNTIVDVSLGTAIFGESDSIDLVGSTVAGNGSEGGSWEVFNNGPVTLRNVVLWNPGNFTATGNSVDADAVCTHGALAGTGIVALAASPFVIVDADGDGIDDYFLDPASPCVDAGVDAHSTAAGIPWETLTTRTDGTLDVTPVDLGRHH